MHMESTVAFLLQQLLDERATVFYYTYITYMFI